MNSDRMTTAIGALMAAGTAATPILTTVQGGSLKQGDWLQLAMAVMISVFGYFTNKQKG